MTATVSDRTYEIHEVAELTGLAAPRLRVWERRYEVVRPHRLPNRYRVYTAEQVALLRAFARLVEAGERIGDLVREERESVISRAEERVVDGSPLSLLLDAIKRLDRGRLESLLAGHRRALSHSDFCRDIILPLGQVVGDLWALGKLTVAAEHLASEVVVGQLKQSLAQQSPTGPVMLAACLPDEQHEWGVLVTMSELARQGWRVHYLGANLPLKDLAEAAWTLVPRVVALSAANPATVIARLPELRRLPRHLPPGTVVVVGGEGAEMNASRLRRAGLKVGLAGIPDLAVEPVRRRVSG